MSFAKWIFFLVLAAFCLTSMPGLAQLRTARKISRLKTFKSAGAKLTQKKVKRKVIGRHGKQPRLRTLASDPKLSNNERGWLKQEMNAMKRRKRRSIRLPPDRELIHPRGMEAAKGNGHVHSTLQAKELHALQHKHDNFGKKRKPVIPQKS